MAARAAGRSYTELIGEIVELAMSRYRKQDLLTAPVVSR